MGWNAMYASRQTNYLVVCNTRSGYRPLPTDPEVHQSSSLGCSACPGGSINCPSYWAISATKRTGHPLVLSFSSLVNNCSSTAVLCDFDMNIRAMAGSFCCKKMGHGELSAPWHMTFDLQIFWPIFKCRCSRVLFVLCSQFTECCNTVAIAALLCQTLQIA